MFKLKFMILQLMFIFLFSCTNVDYLNKDHNSNSINLSSSEIFNSLYSKLNLPNLKSLNENELLEIYAIDPKLLIDYIANVPSDNISGTEISIFRLKEKENNTEVVLGIERRISQLEEEFKSNVNKQNQYDLIKNPYIKIFDNYIIFALYSDLNALDKILQDTFK